MLEAKLIQLLRKFTTRQRTRFKEYVHSPYFNKHKTVMQLCNYLLKYAPDFEHKDLSKQQVFQHLFPKKTYSETKLYTYSSNLLSLLNDFLAVEIFKQETLLEKTKEGFIPSSTRIIELTDRNDKKYKITIEEIT